MKTKRELRKMLLERRQNLSKDDIKKASSNIIHQLSKMEVFKRSKVIGIYMPLGSEMNVLNLLDLYPDKIFCIPKTYGNQMDFIEYDQTTKLIKTNFGLLEPESGKVLNDELDLVIVPTLGMTKDGYRLGYGAGYFDRFFTIYQKPYKIGIIYHGEEIEFEKDEFDIKLDTYLLGWNGVRHDYRNTCRTIWIN